MFVYVRLVSQWVGREPSLWIGQSPPTVHESDEEVRNSRLVHAGDRDSPKGPVTGRVSQT